MNQRGKECLSLSVCEPEAGNPAAVCRIADGKYSMEDAKYLLGRQADGLE